MSASFSPRVGERFADRFELTAPLRGDGAVKAFLAFDHHAGRETELVLFDPECAHPKAWGAFARLVAAAAEAKIAGLVLPRSVGSAPPVPPYCLAEPQAARGLDRLRDQGPLPWRRALTIGERAAEILEKTFAATGAAHRVLTPARCLASARDEVKVLDFAVAELELGAGGESSYRAPGQQAEAGDSRGDVYALAVILFELISGQRCTTAPPPRLRSLVAAPQSVDDLLAKATAPEAKQRHPDIAALRAELRELLGMSPVEPVRKATPAPPQLAGKAASEAAAGQVGARPGVAPPQLAGKAASEAPGARPAVAAPQLAGKAASEAAAGQVGARPGAAAPQLAGKAASEAAAGQVGPRPGVAAPQLPLRDESVEARELDERTAPLPAARTAPAPVPRLERNVEPPVATAPAGELLPLPEREPELATIRLTDRVGPRGAPLPEREPELATIRVTDRAGPRESQPEREPELATVRVTDQVGPDRTVIIESARLTGAQPTLSDRTVVADPARRTGAQATVGRTGAQATVSDPRRTGAQAPVGRTGAQPSVPGGSSRIAPGRGSGAVAAVPGSSRIAPGRGSGAVAAVPGSSRVAPGRGTGAVATVPASRIAPGRGTGMQATLSEHTVVAPGRRTGAQATVSDRTVVEATPGPPMRAVRTEILDPGRQLTAPDRTVVLDPNAAAAGDHTQVTPRSRVDGWGDGDAPSRADTTLLLPYPEDPSRAGAANDDGAAEDEFAAPKPTARAKAPVAWTLRRILIVTNVVLAALVLVGLLVSWVF